MTQLIKGGGLQNHPQEKASHPHCLLNKGGNSFIPPQGTFWNSSSTQLNHFKNYTIIKETRHPTNKHATNNPIIKIHSPSNQILIATRDLIPQSFLGESTARSVVGSLQLSTTRSKFDETGFGKTIADLQAFEKTILRCLPSLEMNNSIFTSLVRVNPFVAEKTTSFFLNLRLFSWESFDSSTHTWTKRLEWLKRKTFIIRTETVFSCTVSSLLQTMLGTPLSRVSELLHSWEKNPDVTVSELHRSKGTTQVPAETLGFVSPVLKTLDCTNLVWSLFTSKSESGDVPEVHS